MCREPHSLKLFRCPPARAVRREYEGVRTSEGPIFGVSRWRPRCALRPQRTAFVLATFCNRVEGRSSGAFVKTRKAIFACLSPKVSWRVSESVGTFRKLQSPRPRTADLAMQARLEGKIFWF